MGRYTDNAPIGNTCPMIDDAISLMEKLRSANEELRGWGNDMFNEKESFEKDLDEANDTIQDLQTEISRLNDDIENLKEELKTIAK